MPLTFSELQALPSGQLIHERRGGGPITSVGNRRLVVEQRSSGRTRPQTRNMREFYGYVETLLASTPRTVTGYRARLAALEELCPQTDGVSSRMGDGAGR
jgi:hypothetical protein